MANLAATARKALTLGVSFLFFPKPFTAMHGVGMFAFFAGLLWNSQRRHQEKLAAKQKLGNSGVSKKTQ